MEAKISQTSILKIFGVLMLLFFSLGACKKTKLVDDREIFVGEWEVDFSLETDACLPNQPWDTISWAESYTVSFLEKGKIIFRKGDEVLSKDRINLIAFSESARFSDGFYFIFELGNGDEGTFEGNLNADTLTTTSDFPGPPPSCYSRVNFFLKNQ